MNTTDHSHLALCLGACLAAGCAQAHAAPPAKQSPPPGSTVSNDAGSAAAPAPGAGDPNAIQGVVLISIDSLRADMPWAGYPRQIAPNLTRFAAQSVQYTHAYSISSYTSASVGGLLAGRYPSEVRRDGAFFNRYSERNVFFPEVLHDAGVRTVGAQAHFYFRHGYAGFDQGFDVWEMVPNLHVDFTTDLDVTGDRHEAIAERLLSDPHNTAGRFFAWFHFMDAHDHYLPHPGIGPYGHSLRDRYDAEVTFADQWVGRLLEFIDHQAWAAHTAVIITSDHGEAFGEHGVYRHAFELWEPLVRVPFMVRLPGVAPRVIDTNRSAIDLAPSVFALLGVAPPEPPEGQSLVAEWRGGDAPERDVVVDLPRTTVSDRRRALVHGRYKLIAFGDDARFEVFDLVQDPTEEHSLRRTDRATYDDMVARYRAASASIHEVDAPLTHH